MQRGRGGGAADARARRRAGQRRPSSTNSRCGCRRRRGRSVRAMAEEGVLGGVSLGRLYPGDDGARQRPRRRRHRDRHPRGHRGARRGARGGAGMSMNREGRPTRAGGGERRRRDLHRQPRLMLEEPCCSRSATPGRDRRRSSTARARSGRRRDLLGGLEPQPADRPARPVRAAGGAPLHPAVAARIMRSTSACSRSARAR